MATEMYRPYLAILSSRMQVLLQYRAAAFAGFVTQFFWGLMRVMIFAAFYASSDAKMPMTLKETTIYIWLSQALFLMFPWNLDSDVARMVRTGNVAYEMVRPIDLYWLWFARAIALRVAPVALRSVPLFIIAGLFFGLDKPHSSAALIVFLIAILFAILLSSAFTVLLNIFLFWTIAGDGIVRTATWLTFFLSGLIVPLPLFPDWSQKIMMFLPFKSMLDTPFRLYMGNIPVRDAPFLILQQILWILFVIIIGRLLLSKAMKRLVVQGG